MKYNVCYLILLSIICLCFACENQITIAERFTHFTPIPERMVISNTLSIPNDPNGHIQGVAYFWDDNSKQGYFFLSGSSDSLSYYVVADEYTQEVIAVDTFFSGALRHAGGMQILDRFLAVGVEDNIKVDRSKVCLYEIIGPANKKLKLLKTIERQGPEKRYTAGCVALAKVKDQLIIAAGNWDTKNIEFYALPIDEVYNPVSAFEEVFSFDTQTADRSKWSDTSWHAYQNISLISESDELYLFGTAKKDTTDFEVIDLYKIKNAARNDFSLQKVAQQIYANPDTTTTFKWGGGVRPDFIGDLNFYSTNRTIEDSLYLDIFRTDRIPH
jgi:hypothetical protein